ncbi:DUF3152 domain-containing protein [Prauserella rugosa]|uniref:Uncharacterized protein DUF3152 n=1 Tax=Prauserella rugosa TaxID=43354 RepID=A0A660CN19_9PSEU|nr:DUF3152 domain-containing protein [Prauserella rugosa]TWH22515.1 uncharacterized protein DUF3152 [Prauserella rugosa]
MPSVDERDSLGADAADGTDDGGPGDRAGGRGDSQESPRRKKSGLGKLLATYGWRVYAIPVLLVVTALVVVDTTQSGSGEPNSGGAASGSQSADPGGPGGVSEIPAKAQDLDIPTAELPDGPDYTKRGQGTWHIVPGSSDLAGDRGQEYSYAVDVEDGIDPSSFAGEDSFASTVEGVLSDTERGWVSTGEVKLRRVDASGPEADFHVSLTTPETAKEICGDAIPYPVSCYRSDMDRVVINLARWVRGAKAFSADLTGYRYYAVNHEVGHAFGNGHVGCEREGGAAPVMMQQTFGVSNDYVAKLNDTEGGDYGTVPADGKTCRPNAYPNPQAQ